MPTDRERPDVITAAALSRRARLAALADMARLAPQHEATPAVLRRLIEKHARHPHSSREETTSLPARPRATERPAIVVDPKCTPVVE